MEGCIPSVTNMSSPKAISVESMVFSKSVDKILFLYTDASRADITDSSVKRRKLRSVRPFRAVRVQNVSNLDLKKTMALDYGFLKVG